MKIQGLTYLSNRGYAIEKKGNEEHITTLKEELTVCAKVNPNMIGNEEPVYFPVYRENEEKLYIPKYYGLQTFGPASKNSMKDGVDCPRLTFHGKIRAEQEAPVQSFIEAVKDPRKMGGIISLPCGMGKCLGKDTPVLMYDGTIKMVQDVKVGDQLMGDDSTPRKVLSTCTGKEEMFDIIPTKGDTYTVNRSHILSLKCATNHSKKLQKGDIRDISVDEYLKLPKSFHGRAGPLYGYRVGVDFTTKEVPMDPYLVGYWLGDGSTRGTIISTQESTVLRYVTQLLPKHNMYLQYRSQYDYSINGANKNTGNPFRQFLHKYNLWGDKHIPLIYKCNSRDVRMQLLAGIIDADGYYSKKGFDITLKCEKLLDDIIYLARSLGFAAYKKECKKTCTNGAQRPVIGTYYRTNISGKNIEKIPTKVIRKQAKPREQIKDVLMTRITPKSIGMGTYYGFEIDGNHRFLLGDFTVTHNTVCGLYIAGYFKKKCLIVCHKDFLANQWKERIAEFLPEATIGTIKQSKVHTKDKDIVIASLQSLAMREYDEAIFKEFGLVIVDEIHHISAEVFSRSLPRITCARMLGLSATLKRKDGLSKVFEWYFGKPVYQIKREDNHLQVIVKRFYDPSPEYGRELKMHWNGKLNVAKMINKVCEFPPRNYMIVQTLLDILKEEPDRQVLILSERRNHLTELENLLKLHHVTSIGYYIGGMKQEELDASAKEKILLGTFQLAQEGMDVPTLNTLILASPVSSIEQAIGRIQRQKKEARVYKPIVIDIVDEFSLFEGQGRKRLAFYKKNDYEIIDTIKEKEEEQKDVKYTFIEDPDDH
jgi:superfamily II DNA or RNA helicase